jgi:radical SAM superfamily enzyme YgiQ (UPF0313 family)
MRKEVLLICVAPESARVQPGSRPVVSRFFRHTRLSLLAVAAATPPDWEVRLADEYVQPVDLSGEPACVGISFMTAGAPRAYELATEFRARGIPVMAGGYHPTFLPNEAARYFDAVCVGDAEPSWPLMLRDMERGELKPVYRSDPLASLEGLPLPRRDLLDPHEYFTRNSVQAARGCPHRCAFCSITSFYGAHYRHRPVPEVLAEIAGLQGKTVIFIDDNLVVDRAYALELFRGLAALHKHWYSQAELSVAQDPELLDAAIASGCKGLFVGLESLSDHSLNSVEKGFCRPDEYLRSLERLHRNGIMVEAGIVFGFDEDGPEVFQRTLNFLLDAHVEIAQITPLTPFPGTPLFQRLWQEERLLTTDWRYYDLYHVVFQPLRMAPEELQAGTDWVVEQFYGLKSLSRRTAASLRCHGLRRTVYPILLLNLAARRRIRTWELRPSRRSPGLDWLPT